jgi:hypothetical protein
MAITSRQWGQADLLATMADEIAEAVEILRPHYPEDGEADLRQRAAVLRGERYQSGRWPSSDELAIANVWDEAHFENVIRKPEPVQSYESAPPSCDPISPAPIEAAPPRRKRGRPRGSKNRPKPEFERAAPAE